RLFPTQIPARLVFPDSLFRQIPIGIWLVASQIASFSARRSQPRDPHRLLRAPPVSEPVYQIWYERPAHRRGLRSTRLRFVSGRQRHDRATASHPDRSTWRLLHRPARADPGLLTSAQPRPQRVRPRELASDVATAHAAA